jgi:phospholipid/cholesterol/gamma-HCH transport system permease protein
MEEGALVVSDRLDRDTARALHDEVIRRLDRGEREVVVDLGRVERTDAFGAAALIESHRVAVDRGARFRLENLSEDLRELLAFFRVDRVIATEPEHAAPEPVLARLGGWGQDFLASAVGQANLCLDGLYMTFIGPFVGRGPRRAHVVYQMDAVGAGSMGIVGLISGLLGLIMALQAAYQLRQFGANIFVANLVGVAMTRELGPLITAIVLAARSGSAMAAELGTMVVTEEVDALKVMAVDPRRFLFAPRFTAMVIAMPLLAILADVAGIFGGLAVGTVGLGISPSIYMEQTVRALHMSDVLTGLVKSFVFACVIVVISCQQGLSLRGGPEAVGRATTRAVVLSILIVIVADFCFTTLFFLLD